MQAIRALFWDVGGVLLTNAWDHEERDLAVERFLLSKPEFEARHKELVIAFEEGKVTLDDYLERTVFYQPRTFTREEFKQFIFSLSRPKPQCLELARNLSGKYVMAVINNESRELNQYRIQTPDIGQNLPLPAFASHQEEEFSDSFMAICGCDGGQHSADAGNAGIVGDDADFSAIELHIAQSAVEF